MFKSTKTFGHDLGISCAFRQWRATHSHCSKLHGYAISIHYVFAAKELDHRNWVIDFGGLKTLKQQIMDTFDHKTVVAEDDPLLDNFKVMHELGALDLVIVPAVGCEQFAKYAHDLAVDWLHKNGHSDRVRVESVEIREHGANSAIYKPATEQLTTLKLKLDASEVATQIQGLLEQTKTEIQQIITDATK